MKASDVDKFGRSCIKACGTTQAVQTVRTLNDLERFRDIWTELQGVSTEDIDFFRLIVTSRPEVLRPHVMLLKTDNVPRAIMAGRLEKSKLDFKFGYKSIWKQRAHILAIADGGFMGDVSKESAFCFVQSLAGFEKRRG
jgi:hypothetical protein